MDRNSRSLFLLITRPLSNYLLSNFILNQQAQKVGLCFDNNPFENAFQTENILYERK